MSISDFWDEFERIKEKLVKNKEILIMTICIELFEKYRKDNYLSFEEALDDLDKYANSLKKDKLRNEDNHEMRVKITN